MTFLKFKLPTLNPFWWCVYGLKQESNNYGIYIPRKSSERTLALDFLIQDKFSEPDTHANYYRIDMDPDQVKYEKYNWAAGFDDKKLERRL